MQQQKIKKRMVSTIVGKPAATKGQRKPLNRRRTRRISIETKTETATATATATASATETQTT